jgi:hypothetical protein
LSLGSLPILTRLAEARLATAALEADDSLDYDAPELLAAYAHEDDLDRQFHEYFGTRKLDDNRAVVAFGPASPFRRFLQTTTGDSLELPRFNGQVDYAA